VLAQKVKNFGFSACGMKLIIQNNMYAIIDFNGFQYKVEKDAKLYVNRLEAAEGETFDIEKVLLVDIDGKVKVGTPVVKGAKVSAKVLEHLKGDKVIVFKKKRRKGYKVKNGHRQYLTQIQIEEIVG
jgi:large subunit ribosomal protein L21